MDKPTLSYYDQHAANVAARYEQVNIGDMQRMLAAAFPPGARLLELGCGSGRDADYLLTRGFDVQAVDGAAAMVLQAADRHAALNDRLHHVVLPGPLPFHDQSFDGVYSIAMLMHLKPDAQPAVFAEAARVLRPGGRLWFSVPSRRPDAGQDERDKHGRLLTSLAPSHWEALCTGALLSICASFENPDNLGRPGVTWISFMAEKRTDLQPPSRGMNPGQ